MRFVVAFVAFVLPQTSIATERLAAAEKSLTADATSQVRTHLRADWMIDAEATRRPESTETPNVGPRSSTRSPNIQSHTENNYYIDYGAPYPSIVRLGDRVTMGYTNADPMTSNAPRASLSWAAQSTSSGSMGWLELIAGASFYPTAGGVAVAAASRASDYKIPTNGKSAWGYTAFSLADSPHGAASGAYFEARTVEPTASAIGLEIDVGSYARLPPPVNPYQLNNGGSTIGLLLGAGGDPATPGPSWDSSAAIGVGRNKQKFLRGLVISSEAISGTDGVKGSGIAIELAKGHEIRWTDDVYANRGGFIKSTTEAGNTSVGLVFSNGALNIVNNSELKLGSFDASGKLTLTGNISSRSFIGEDAELVAAHIRSGQLTIGAATGGPVSPSIKAAAGKDRQLIWYSGTIPVMAAGIGGPEDGKNSGADFAIVPYDDFGISLGKALTVTRSSGLTTAKSLAITMGTPASSTAACSAGQIMFDASHIYTCVASNTWRRSKTESW